MAVVATELEMQWIIIAKNILHYPTDIIPHLRKDGEEV